LVESERRAAPDEERIRAETQRRIAEAERAPEAAAPPTDVRPEAPERAGPEGRPKPAEPPAPAVAELRSERREALLAELRAAEQHLERRRAGEQQLAREIEETAARLAASQRRTAEALERAELRLKEAEARASEAESRAEEAERLAKLKTEETDRETQLREVLDRIARTEERAAEAEQRARESVWQITDPGAETESTGSQSRAEDFAVKTPPAQPAAPPSSPDPSQAAWIPQPPESAEPEPSAAGGGSEEPTIVSEGGPLNLNEATYEDLRRLRLSVTQAGRVLAYRDRFGGFKSLDQLDGIPGFSKAFLTELKPHLTV
jgi:DNA uptake protein ComE-like DNA-binding protein